MGHAQTCLELLANQDREMKLTNQSSLMLFLETTSQQASRRSEELEQQQPPVSKAAGDQTGKFSLFLPNEPLKHEA